MHTWISPSLREGIPDADFPRKPPISAGLAAFRGCEPRGHRPYGRAQRLSAAPSLPALHPLHVSRGSSGTRLAPFFLSLSPPFLLHLFIYFLIFETILPLLPGRLAVTAAACGGARRGEAQPPPSLSLPPSLPACSARLGSAQLGSTPHTPTRPPGSPSAWLSRSTSPPPPAPRR